MSGTKKTRVNIISSLFYVAYAIFIVISMTRWVNNTETIRTFLSYLYKGILVYIFIFNLPKLNYKEAFKLVLIGIIGLLTAYISKDQAIFNISLFLINAKNADFKKLIKVDLITKSITFIFVVLLYKLGMTEEVVYYTLTRGIRYSFGFGHPNTFGVYLLGISADLIYLCKNKYKKFVYLLLICFALFINHYCDSRGSTLGIILLILLSIFLDKDKITIIKKVTKYIYPSFAIISVAMAIIFKNGSPSIIYSKLDNLLSYRLTLMGAFFNHYPITLFGNYFIDYHTTNRLNWTYVLDNAYVTLLLKYGILAFMYFFFAIPSYLTNAIKEKNNRLIICSLVYAMFGLMENGLFVLFYNPFLLAIGINIFKKQEENNENRIDNKE